MAFLAALPRDGSSEHRCETLPSTVMWVQTQVCDNSSIAANPSHGERVIKGKIRNNIDYYTWNSDNTNFAAN